MRKGNTISPAPEPSGRRAAVGRRNPAGCLNGLRMEYAARLPIQHPEYAIEAIAQESGIPDVSSFPRFFKAKFGMTPAEPRSTGNRIGANGESAVASQFRRRLVN